jgi:hypothetical protein
MLYAPRQRPFTGRVMTFHNSTYATQRCVCHVVGSYGAMVGVDAFDQLWSVVTDDFGNIVFVK